MVIAPTDLGATTAVAPGLMLDNFLPIPDAESLPFYPSVLKLVVCVCVGEEGRSTEKEKMDESRDRLIDI